MKKISFVIIDDDLSNGLNTKAVAESFQTLRYVDYADNYDDAIDCILEHNPDIIFLEIDPKNKESKLSLYLINELYRFLSVIPKIYVTAKDESKCIEAFKYGVSNYFLNPVTPKDLRKAVILLEKELSIQNDNAKTFVEVDALAVPQNFVSEEKLHEELKVDVLQEESIAINHIELGLDEKIQNEDEKALMTDEFVEEESQRDEMDFDIIGYKEKHQEVEEEIEEEPNQPKELSFIYDETNKTNSLIICVKSYGDYRYIEAKDICYLQADNNSTDIHLNGGEMITAFKTLKHFENILSYPFIRIHNSYIINSEYVSRIHTGNAVCHIKDTTIKLPFSKSYKENVDFIISKIASGNYIEI